MAAASHMLHFNVQEDYWIVVYIASSVVGEASLCLNATF